MVYSNNDDPVVNAIYSISYALKSLGNGDAADPMGALEAHGQCIREVAAALNNIANAIREFPVEGN